MTTGPDGALYIVDAYRGIIQEGAWTRKGSYLRGVVERFGFDKNIQRGRIWRLVHDSWKPGPQPHMLDEKPAQLVRHLEHPNGWWRDTAQKLLILRGDRSVVAALTSLLRKHKDPKTRVHALWTLEGLGALSPELAKQALEDGDARVRENAIRAAESVAKAEPEAGREAIVTAIRGRLADTEPTVVMQVLGTAARMRWPDHVKLIREQSATNGSDGVAELGKRLLRAMDPSLLAGLNEREQQLVTHGRGVYLELCFSCHGEDGKGAPLSAAPAGVNTSGQTGTTIAPALVGSRVAAGPSDVAIRVLLHGLVGPAPDGKTYGAAMVAMKDNDDQWIASVLSYVRRGLAKQASVVKPDDVARVRKDTVARTEPFTVAELDRLAATLPPARERSERTAGQAPQAK
jgi:mono/diheme cytochrome c family protein